MTGLVTLVFNARTAPSYSHTVDLHPGPHVVAVQDAGGSFDRS